MTWKQIFPVLGCLGIAIGLASAVAAQQRDYSTSGRPLARGSPEDELDALFAAFCLMKFPNAGAADLYARSKGFKPMPEGQRRTILGKDPGFGWLYYGGFGTYAMTIEQSPDHACAVRTRLAGVADIHTAFGTTLTLWAATQHAGSLKGLPAREEQIEGRRTERYLWQLTGDNSKETFAAIVTPFPRQEAEIRLVRSIDKP